MSNLKIKTKKTKKGLAQEVDGAHFTDMVQGIMRKTQENVNVELKSDVELTKLVLRVPGLPCDLKFLDFVVIMPPNLKHDHFYTPDQILLGHSSAPFWAETLEARPGLSRTLMFPREELMELVEMKLIENCRFFNPRLSPREIGLRDETTESIVENYFRDVPGVEIAPKAYKGADIVLSISKFQGTDFIDLAEVRQLQDQPESAVTIADILLSSAPFWVFVDGEKIISIQKRRGLFEQKCQTLCDSNRNKSCPHSGIPQKNHEEVKT